MKKERTRVRNQNTNAALDDLQEAGEDEFAEAPVIEHSLEELDEQMDDLSRERELAVDGPVDTQHSDGSAYYPLEAEEQGLVYTPPDDPPVIPSDDLQGVEMAAGFGKAMEEEDDPRAEVLPSRLENSDFDLEEKINDILRKSSEGAQFDNVQVVVRDGIVHLTGTVETLEDIDVLGYLIQAIEGVVDVEEHLKVAAL